jgi:lysophospholipase L1-like esterase
MAGGQWESDIQRFEAADKTNHPPKNAVLFIGSSGIALWKTLAADFPRHQVINRGFGGSHIADSVQYADRIVVPYAPKLIVLRAGTNDIAAGKTPEQIAADFQAFVATVRAKLPETRIAFMSLNPSPARWENFAKESQANALIKACIARGENLDYIDVVAAMLGPDGKPRPELYAPDRLHNSPAGYRLWTALVEPHLPVVTLLPLGVVPKRPDVDTERLRAAWQEAVFALYLAEDKIEPEVAYADAAPFSPVTCDRRRVVAEKGCPRTAQSGIMDADRNCFPGEMQ